jgi:hypothetical protein
MSRELKDTLNALIHARKALRAFFSVIDYYHEQRGIVARKVRKLRATGNRFDARRAELLEQDDVLIQQSSRQKLDTLRAYIRDIGRILMQYPAPDFPQALLLDFLEVNPADRKEVEPGDGLVEIVYIHGLEYSACNRGDSVNQGPFARAIIAHLHYKLIHNEEMKKWSDDVLFGKGGMFEFLPMYKENEQGEMVRQPPPLRLA